MVLLDDLHRRIARLERADTAEGSLYGAADVRRGPSRARARPATSRARFACPICGGRYREFLPFGLNGRPHARCPGCGSLERHRFLWLYLTRWLRLTERRARVLHVAPEPCIRQRLMARRGLRYVSIDMFDREADRRADLKALPFADGSFDVVICSHVLEHIADDRTAIAEIGRVLAPDARALVMVPIDLGRAQTYEDATINTAAARNAAFGHPYHVRICGADYPDRLRDPGLEVVTRSSAALSPHRRRLWRINKTVLFDCRKPRQG